MKKYIPYCLIVLLCLSGCEEMFYREVDFTVEGEQEKLVLNSNSAHTLLLDVSHSSLATKSHSRKDSFGITDAQVSVRVNHGEWHTLYNQTNRSVYYMLDSAGSKKGFSLAPLDTLEIDVTHASYPAVHVRQILPGKVNARIVQTAPMTEGWMEVVLEIAPYHGNADDVIGIVLKGGKMLMHKKNSVRKNDTMHLDLSYLYSTDAAFSTLENIRIGAYYGSTGTHCLYLPASSLQQPLQVALIADGRWVSRKAKRADYFPIGVSGLTLEVSAYTGDSYLYEQFRRKIQDVSIQPPYGIPSDDSNFMQEILEDIAGALGGQELTAPFGNVEGGFGCVRLYQPTDVTQE